MELLTAPLAKGPPFRPDAVVREEDSYLVLGTREPPAPPDASVSRLARRAASFRPKEPGSVVVTGCEPLELAAVVHDLDREPTWRRQWVEEAVERVFEEVRTRWVRRLALPMLGAVHGALSPYDFWRLTSPHFAPAPPSLEAMCLLVPRQVDPRDARAVVYLWRRGGKAPGEGGGRG